MSSRAPSACVAICIVTFRRPDGLRRLLEGIAAQTFARVARPKVELFVVDNDETGSAREVCEKSAANLGLDLRYSMESRAGIPFVRNAALAATTTDHDWLVFIDDDEVPTERWLDGLLATQAATGSECVAGRVVPVFPPQTPGWIRKGRWFGNEPGGRRQHKMVASTGNSMISRQAVRRLGLEFDASLGLTGGEDTLFLLQAGRGGIDTAFAVDAVVHEQVVPGRLTLWRLLRRQFRFGNTLSICDLALGASLRERSVRLAKGCALIGQGLLLLPLAPFRGMGGLAHALGRLARGLGTLTGLAGHRFEEYRRDRNLDV